MKLRLSLGKGGFSLVELLVVAAVFVVIVGIAGQIYGVILQHTAQQSRISETQATGVIGLEMLRTDLEHTGFGLPWAFQDTINYNEAIVAAVCGGATTDPSSYNDAPANVPRALVTGDNVCINGSDYLVIKGTNAARSDAAQRWSYVTPALTTVAWGADDFLATDRVIVIRPAAGEVTRRQLRVNGGVFSDQFQNLGSFVIRESDAVYGLDPNNMRMPFNRADFFISTANVPAKCAPNTGVLVKAIVNQADGAFSGVNTLSYLDCVADMQVVLRLDMNENGTTGTFASSGATSVTADTVTLDAEGATQADVAATLADPSLLRKRLKEVRIYILTHEGSRDRSYLHNVQTMTVGEFGMGMPFDLNARIGAGWQNYRWRIYTVVVKPKNLY